MEKKPIHRAYALGPLREGESHLILDEDMRRVIIEQGYTAWCGEQLPFKIFNTQDGYILGKTIHFEGGSLRMLSQEITCTLCRQKLTDLMLQ